MRDVSANYGFSDSFQWWHSTFFNAVSQAEVAVTSVSSKKNGLYNTKTRNFYWVRSQSHDKQPLKPNYLNKSKLKYCLDNSCVQWDSFCWDLSGGQLNETAPSQWGVLSPLTCSIAHFPWLPTQNHKPIQSVTLPYLNMNLLRGSGTLKRLFKKEDHTSEFQATESETSVTLNRSRYFKT